MNSDDEDAQGGTVACLLQPSRTIASYGFSSNTPEGSTYTTHTASHIHEDPSVSLHTHTHTHDSTLRNSADPLKIVLRGKTVCSFTRYHSLESTAVCSAAGSQAPCLMALHLNVYSLRPISAAYRQLSSLPLTSEQTHLRSITCHMLIFHFKVALLRKETCPDKAAHPHPLATRLLLGWV